MTSILFGREGLLKNNGVGKCKCPRAEKIATNAIYFVIREFRYGQSTLVLAPRKI